MWLKCWAGVGDGSVAQDEEGVDALAVHGGGAFEVAVVHGVRLAAAELAAGPVNGDLG